jgi:HEPN domain-containing protein
VDLPKSEAEFDKLMDELDSRFQKGDVPLPMRQLEALGVVASELKLKLPVTPPEVKPTPNVFTGASMSAHIYHWYRNRYGDRLNTNYFTLGAAVVVIKGIAWRMVITQRIGDVRLFCDRDLTAAADLRINTRGPAFYNVLCSIQGLTQELASTLSEHEQRRLYSFYESVERTLSAIKRHEATALVSAAANDLESCVDQLVAGDFASSRWSSLQFIEKIAKGLLREKGGHVSFTHELKDIFDRCEKEGFAKIPSHLADSVQCRAGIRYGEKKVTLEEAIKAHHASLEIAGILLS